VSEQARHHLSAALQRDLADRCYGWLEGMADGCVVLDQLRAVHYCNPAFAAIWGRSVAELLGGALTEALPDFQASGCQRLCDRAQLQSRLQEGDARIGDRWYQVRAHPLADGVLAFMTDVTPRRQAEDDAVNTALHLRLLLEQVCAIHWVVNKDLYILRMTGAGLGFLGLAENELVGGKLQDFFRTNDPDSLPVRMHRRALDGERVRYADDFAGRHYEVSLEPTRDAEGRVVGVAGLAHDVTEHRRTEAEHLRVQERLHQAEKLESLGVLVGGVAHDFNNLLVGMLNGAELLLRELPEASSLRGTAEMIRTAGLRARDVAQQMLVLVGKGRATRQPLDVNGLLQQNLPLLEVAFRERVQVQTAFHEGLPLVPADAGQMQQVVMNLLMNAAEALPPTGGTIRVSTGLTAREDPVLTTAPEAPADSYVFFEVADDGNGMAPEIQARIFEPFFTTKSTGHGLGLAAVKNIVRSLNGVIHLSSTPGRGTTFRIYLPSVQTARPEEQGEPNDDPAPPPGEILIVDDEPFVRDVVARMLHKAGYKTRAAGSGAEALDLARDHPEIGLVVLDLKMPGMDGWETLRRLAEIRPNLRAILTSGCAGDEQPDRDDPRVVGFLPKPYVIETLLQLVRQGFERGAHA
jgi:two-component system, cell cycle sensor histidine kinase and response regulator CckA